MSDILKVAHGMAVDLHEVGAMDTLTLRKMDLLCLPPQRTFTAEDVRRIRASTRMSQPVFAAALNVGKTTVAQWEQGRKKPRVGGSYPGTWCRRRARAFNSMKMP